MNLPETRTEFHPLQRSLAFLSPQVSLSRETTTQSQSGPSTAATQCRSSLRHCGRQNSACTLSPPPTAMPKSRYFPIPRNRPYSAQLRPLRPPIAHPRPSEAVFAEYASPRRKPPCSPDNNTTHPRKGGHLVVPCRSCNTYRNGNILRFYRTASKQSVLSLPSRRLRQDCT